MFLQAPSAVSGAQLADHRCREGIGQCLHQQPSGLCGVKKFTSRVRARPHTRPLAYRAAYPAAYQTVFTGQAHVLHPPLTTLPSAYPAVYPAAYRAAYQGRLYWAGPGPPLTIPLSAYPAA